MNLYIEKHTEAIDNCRFCWMCRHVCTQGKVTSNEVHTARALGLLLASINRGINDYNLETAEILFQCCQCGYCKEWCVSSYDAPAFVRAGRVDAIKLGFIPQPVQAVIESLDTYGHPFGSKINSHGSQTKTGSEIITDGKPNCRTLLYLGAFARYLRPEVGKAAISLLKKLGVDFTLLENEPNSGYYYYNLGFIEKGEKQSKKVVDAFKNGGYKTVVVISPADYYIMTNEYDKKLLEDAGIKITPLVSLISSLDIKPMIKPVKPSDYLKLAYNDSSYLARYMNITDEPRNVLKAVFGDKLRELHWNGKLAKSSGSGLLLTYPEMALNIARKLLSEVREEGVSTLVVSGAEAKESLLRAIKCESSCTEDGKDENERTNICSIEVMELAELMDRVI